MRKDRHVARKKRATRVRHNIRASGDSSRPRLSIFRSNKNIYAQIIDDTEGRTLVAVSTKEKEIQESTKNGGNCEAASAVGKRIAEMAREANITQVVFDRGGYLYHGRTKVLAEAAREGGLEF